jgi:hypothetical protein
MLKKLTESACFDAGDLTHLRELLHPSKDGVNTMFSLAHAYLEPGGKARKPIFFWKARVSWNWTANCFKWKKTTPFLSQPMRCNRFVILDLPGFLSYASLVRLGQRRRKRSSNEIGKLAQLIDLQLIEMNG